MGAADGAVLGLTKLLNNGPDDRRHNIVLVAEGFASSEQGDFNALCDEFVTTLQAEPWFPELGRAINVFRLNVESNESGADDPPTCPDGSTGNGTMVATFFDASFCNGGIRRCLLGDGTLVSNTLTAQLPQWHSASVLVNTTQRGGCASGRIFWTGISSDWKEVVLHELGHASFGLADEYPTWAGCTSGETDHNDAPAFEPVEPNVTTETDLDALKWKYFVEPSTPVPTMENPDCSECDERSNVLSDDTIIGLYEGSQYFHCGRFRPAYTCKMRDSTQPFCRVCVDGIARVLANFMDGEEPTVEVIPTLLEFGDVAHGLTMFRAFEIRNVKVSAPLGVTIQLSAITGDPAFSYPNDTEFSFRLPAPVFESFTSMLVFVSFTSADDGVPAAFGSLTVDSLENTSDLPVTVSFTARAIEPPPVDSVLVIDRSDSMEGDSGIPGQTKMDHAIDAARLYISLLKANDRIGIVRYNDEARDPEDILLGMRLADAAGKSDANNVLTAANLDPDGFTSIGGGIILGSSVLDSGAADNRALVVLTDGIQNRDPDIPEATAIVRSKVPEQRVFAVGLGLNQLEDKLNQIASFTNGVAQITGDLVDDKEFLLQKLYVQILSDVSDEAFVRDPKQVALPGEAKSTSVYLGEVDVSVDFVVVFRKHPVFPKYVQIWLEAPDGTIVDAGNLAGFPNFDLVRASGHMYFRVQFPAFPDRPEAHIGRWRVWVRNLTSRDTSVNAASTHFSGGIPFYYSVMAKARSDFRLGGRIEQFEYRPGKTMRVVLEPTLHGFPVDLIEPVEVELLRPNGSRRRLRLTRNSDGEYETFYTDTGLVGIYLFTAEVSARTPRGEYITRYRVMTGLIFVPGSTGGGHDGGGGNDGNGGGNNGQDAKCCKEILARMDKLIGLLQKKG